MTLFDVLTMSDVIDMVIYCVSLTLFVSLALPVVFKGMLLLAEKYL